VADPEAEVLALADHAGLDGLAARHEQGHVGVAEPERRQPVELVREAERQLGAGNDRVDPRHRRHVLVAERGVRVRRESGGECLQAAGLDRETGGGAVAAVAA